MWKNANGGGLIVEIKTDWSGDTISNGGLPDNFFRPKMATDFQWHSNL
jgi:hypothetical protein